MIIFYIFSLLLLIAQIDGAFQSSLMKANDTGTDICFQNVSCSELFRIKNRPEAPPFTLKQLLTVLPKFEDSLPTQSSNPICARHSQFTLQKADQLELWALKMLDSSGKPASGLLKGNINQMGDFDQCLGSYAVYKNGSSSEEEIYGKYCLAAIDFTLPATLYELDRLVHSHHVIRSKLTDPSHRIPRFSSMHWAVCIPDSCSADDVHQMIKHQLSALDVVGLRKEISVEEFMCYSKNKPPPISVGTILTVGFFVGIVGLTLLATILDYDNGTHITKSGEMKYHDVLIQSFSLKKTVATLLDLRAPPDDVACLHGIRALNALALLLSHKCMQLLFYPYVNRTQMTELISYPWSMLGRSAIVYTDSFILLSGCLAAQSFLKIFERKQGRILNSFISRFFRLTPNLIAIILFCTFILPILNSGPLWNNVVTRHAELCKQNWWQNVLYIHNYLGFETMCLTHTHQLGIDMQLYIFSPFLVYLLWRRPALGVITSIVLATLSTYLRYYATLKHQLSPIIYFGVSVSQLFNTASLSYILPTHRATVYIMGIFLGYYLHYRSTTPIKLTYMQVQIGTFVATLLGFAAIYGPYAMSDRNYKYDAKQNAEYMAFSPFIWSIALIWGILINVNNYTGTVGEFFKWNGFRVFTRIAYAVYLVQFPVFFYNVGTARSPRYFTSQVLFNFEEYAVIILISVIVTLLFDLPFQNITKLIKLKSSRNVSTSKTEIKKVN